jgi:hypothetical protein
MHYRSDTEEQFKPVSFTLCIHFYSCPASSNYAYSSAYLKKNSYHHSATLSFRQTLHHPPSIPFLFSPLFSKALTLKNGNIRRHNYFYSNIESEQLSTPKVLSVANLQTGFLSRADRISTHVTFFHNMNSVWAKFPDSDQR